MMSKIFSVEVESSFLDKHKALVSVYTLQQEPIFHIQFMDDFLREIFGTEHIRYKGADGYQHCNVDNDDLAVLLIERLARAIEQKLYGRTALIRRLFNRTN
jgi:hypothetical protein